MDAVEWAVKRQVLGDIIGDVTSIISGATSAVGGVIGGDDTATSTVDGGGGIIPTLPVSSDTETSTTVSSTQSSSASSSVSTTSSTTSSSSSSTSSSSSSTLISSSTSSSSSSTSITSTSSSVPTTTSSPTSSSVQTSVTAPPVTTITATNPGGGEVTSVVTASSSADPSSSSGASEGDSNASPVGAKSFLENKVLSGVVFGIAGLIALIGLIFLTTWYMRRTRKKNLLDEAVSFAPQSHGYGGDEMSRGLTQTSNRNSASSGSLHGAMSGYRPDAPPMPAYQQQQPYYGATGGADPYPTYAAPSQIANAMNTYDNPGMADVGGGVTRKYSNVSRVPVPNAPHDMYGGYRQ